MRLTVLALAIVMLTVGQVPLTAVAARAPGAPAFRVAVPTDRSPALRGATEFRLAQLFWGDASKRWSIAGFGEPLHDDDTIDAPLVSAILPRLHDRASAHLVVLASYDLTHSADRVTIAEFIADSIRVAEALRAGKVVPGVRAALFELR